MDFFDINLAKSLGGGGGGGGGGDFTTANVTLTTAGPTMFYGYTEDADYNYETLSLLNLNDKYYTYATFCKDYVPTTLNLKVLLIDGVGKIFGNVYQENTTVTGDAEVVFDEWYGDFCVAISGDCTITIDYGE